MSMSSMSEVSNTELLTLRSRAAAAKTEYEFSITRLEKARLSAESARSFSMSL